MSRAVVLWPGSGRPEALRKTVPRMPSARALAVIMMAKARAGGAGLRAEDDRNQPPAIALGGRHKVVSGSAGEPGLDPVIAGGQAQRLRDNDVILIDAVTKRRIADTPFRRINPYRVERRHDAVRAEALGAEADAKLAHGSCKNGHQLALNREVVVTRLSPIVENVEAADPVDGVEIRKNRFDR